MSEQILKERAEEYARLSGNTIDFATPLGRGTDGCVWKTMSKTAVKALNLEKNYNIELECYQRLKAENVVSLQGFAVPQLIAHDDRLLIIEMRIVTAPFILDFAKSHLDARPDFSDETWEEWEQDCRERFGASWPRVHSLIFALQKYGIYYYDAKPGNIAFGEVGEG